MTLWTRPMSAVSYNSLAWRCWKTNLNPDSSDLKILLLIPSSRLKQSIKVFSRFFNIEWRISLCNIFAKQVTTFVFCLFQPVLDAAFYYPGNSGSVILICNLNTNLGLVNGSVGHTSVSVISVVNTLRNSFWLNLRDTRGEVLGREQCCSRDSEGGLDLYFGIGALALPFVFFLALQAT
jgi:hypothetical protein